VPTIPAQVHNSEKALNAAATTTMPAVSEATLSQLVSITGINMAKARSLLEAHNGDLERCVREVMALKAAEEKCEQPHVETRGGGGAAATGSAPPAQQKLVEPGEYVCTRHWRAPAAFENCLELIHGDRLTVAWNDGQLGGWVLATKVDDPRSVGYCPQDALAPAPAAMVPLAIGDRLRAVSAFVEPPHVQGYLTLKIGDEVLVAHQVEEPCVWAYATHVQKNRIKPLNPGWVPCSVLRRIGGPCRAG